MDEYRVNTYVPFEYPEIRNFVPNILPSHEFRQFNPPLTHKHEGAFYALSGINIYFGPFNSRSAARRAALRK